MPAGPNVVGLGLARDHHLPTISSRFFHGYARFAMKPQSIPAQCIAKGETMRSMTLAACGLLAVLSVSGPTAEAHDSALVAELQQTVDTFVAQRSQIEGISGVSLQVDLGSHRPVIAVFSGTDGRKDAKPIDRDTLFQVGSNTKHFTAALVLKLEAEGKLSIDQTIGDWLPEYSAWRDVTIRSLLNMTAIVPNYSETPEIGQLIAADIHHQFTFEDLIDAVNPDKGRVLPPNPSWFYSNTNDILAARIIEAASGLSYKDALTTFILRPLHLRETFYSDDAYPRRVLKREPRSLYMNEECLIYQPVPCTVSTLAPLVGKDMRKQNLSWAGPAGAMVSTPHDLAKWIRALFQLRVFPQKQLDEMTSLVSQETGKPIADVGPDDPRGFGLDLGRLYQAGLGGPVWFYQGTTLGSRAIFAYWPQYDLVITAATNSQPPEGEDEFGAMVIGPAFTIVRDSGALGGVQN
jgi:D-alanyl-D-alanine carboxypeptidase